MSKYRSVALGVLFAIVLPVAIALVFPHPMRRIVLPAVPMLVVIGVATLYWNVFVGSLAAVASILAIWYFNLAPGYSFGFENVEDGLAVAAFFVFMVAFVFVLTIYRDRDRRAVSAQTRAAVLAESQRRMVSEMQRVLLPQRPVPVRGIEVASHYVAGGTEAEPIGGDWFAFIPVHECALGVAIGDVVGHGLDAVSAMVEYRFTMRIVGGDGCDPAIALSRLREGLAMYGQDTPATGLYGVLDAELCSWKYASAGHMPPIVVRRDGRAEVLDDVLGQMFSPLPPGELATDTVHVEPADVIALYTDGLVERRLEPLDQGIARLAQHLLRVDLADLAVAAETVINDLVGPAPADDAALVLLRIASI